MPTEVRPEVARWLLATVEELLDPAGSEHGWDKRRDQEHLGNLAVLGSGAVGTTSSQSANAALTPPPPRRLPTCKPFFYASDDVGAGLPHLLERHRHEMTLP